ncbi:MAG: YceD family protein [Runella sp.]
MKTLTQYDIDIYGLKDKQYVYEFEASDSFFEALEQEMIQKGHFKVNLTLDKSATMIQLRFVISGNIIQVCDRSLEEYQEPIELKKQLILKFGDRNEELSDDIELIRHDTVRINIAKYLFEYIALALPMKKLHPRYRQNEIEITDNEPSDILIYQTPNDTSSDEILDEDPRWAALNHLRNN